MGEIKVVNNKLVYDGFFKIYEKEFLLEHGITHEFCVMKQKNAAAVLPITSDNKIILVKQYRVGIEEYVLEIPAGLVDEGETHFECAERELLEETGCSSNNIEYFSEYCTAPGITDEVVKIFIAKNVQKISDLKLDETEFITVHEYELDEVLEMINKGLIKDSKTMISILKYKLSL